MATTHVLGVPLLAVGEALALGRGGPVLLPEKSPFPLTPESAQSLGSTQMRLFQGFKGVGVGLPLSEDPGHTRRVLALSS